MKYSLNINHIELPGDLTHINNCIDYYMSRFIIPENTTTEVIDLLRSELSLAKICSLKEKDQYFQESLLKLTDLRFSFEKYDLYELIKDPKSSFLYDTYYFAGININSNYIFIVADKRTQLVRSNHTLLNMYCQYLKGLPADSTDQQIREYAENLFFLNHTKLNYLIEKEFCARMSR